METHKEFLTRRFAVQWFAGAGTVFPRTPNAEKTIVSNEGYSAYFTNWLNTEGW